MMKAQRVSYSIILALTCMAFAHCQVPPPPIIAGIQPGMSANKVLALFGAPDYKSGVLGATGTSSADWFTLGLSVTFSNGKVTKVSSTKKHKATSVLDVGSLRSEIIKKYGRPIYVVTTQYGSSETFGDAGLEYTFGIGKEECKEVACDPAWAKTAKRLKEIEARPDYRLKLVECSVYCNFPSDNPRHITSAETNGIVRNDRDTTVDIKIRVTFYTSDKHFIKADETTISGVKPGESKPFSITTLGVGGNAKSNIFKIELFGLG